MSSLIINNVKEIDDIIYDVLQKAEGDSLYEVVSAWDLNISNCVGCNECWLKTPGECRIKDDYEELMKKALKVDKLWLVADTKFGFIDYKAKNVFDRILPVMTMNLRFVDGIMRHYPRYDHFPCIGLLYFGEADKSFMNEWMGRVASNLNTVSLGAKRINDIEEAIKCI